MIRLAPALGLALAACSAPPSAELSAEPPFIAATATALARFEMVLPTDLALRADGGFDVLDGYGGHIWGFDADGAAGRVLDGSGAWGRPVRFLADGQGGYWLAAPASGLDAGALLWVDATGVLQRTLMLEPEGEESPFSPVALG